MRTKIIIIILIISVFISLVTYFVLFTTAGSKAIVTTLISKYTDAKNITFENVAGTIAQGVYINKMPCACGYRAKRNSK